ncbi:MAG: rod shape-determining protein MreD [Thermomicrobiales bacterium]
MTRITFGLLLFVTIFAQATLLPSVNPLAITPDLVLVLLFLWSAVCGPREALFWVFVGGVTLDILSMDPLGTNALALVCVALLAGLARQRLYQSTVIVPVVLVVIATLIHGFVLYTLRGTSLDLFLLLQAVLHAILVPFIYFFVRRLARVS